MIGFAGLSHLGVISSIAAAAQGQSVIGYDADEALVANLQVGTLPILEPDLPELLASVRPRIEFRSDPRSLAFCDVIYFSVDVPTDRHNRSDPSVVRQLIDRVAAFAKPGCVLVVLSQVPPGFTRGTALALQAAYPNKGFTVYCQVETLIFGRAVERALHPERYIVGCADASAPLHHAYEALLRTWPCPILPMRYESAELAKISINMCLVSSVSVANTLAELCETIGANWNEIAPALKLDKRIGQHAYLSPGLGLSGGNLERDLVTVQTLAQQHGTDAGVVDAWLVNSAYRRDWLLRTLHREVLCRPEKATVALWGLAYKPNTHSIKNSPAYSLLEALGKVCVRAYDPQVVLGPGLFPDVRQVSDPLEACQGASGLVIATPWPQFAALDAGKIRMALSGKVVIDPFGVFTDLGSEIRHFRLGVPVSRQEQQHA